MKSPAAIAGCAVVLALPRRSSPDVRLDRRWCSTSQTAPDADVKAFEAYVTGRRPWAKQARHDAHAREGSREPPGQVILASDHRHSHITDGICLRKFPFTRR
jgi:hypothetical protein